MRFTDKKAVSPVIATLIIVSITIAIAISATIWWSESMLVFQKIEKVDLTVYTEPTQDGNKLTINIKNTGTRNTIINGIYLNDKPLWQADVARISFYIEGVNQTLPMAFSLPIGKMANIELYLSQNYRAGQAVEVKLITEGGTEISKIINL